jgi:hypothetical protein
MKIGSVTKFLVTTMIVFLSLAGFSCSNNNVSTINTNEGVINSKDFYVSSNSTALKTSARGTIFVEKDKSNNYKAQIVAWVEVDPMDWGGVEFDIPFGWEITNITSSYPNSSNNIDKFETFDQVSSKWNQFVDIGRAWNYDVPSGGGNGSVIIELAAYPKGQKPSKALKIMAGVGSNGSQFLYPDYETIEVPILQQPSEPHSNATPTPSSNTSDAYDFPIKPGTDAWLAFNSHDEMLNACQIPEPLLKNMSTSGLVETVMNYPLSIDIMAYNDPQSGINAVSAQFNGLSELLKRQDSGTSLLNKYMTMDPAAIGDNWTELQKGEYFANFFYIETILAQESVLSTMTPGELQTLLEQVNAKLQAEQNNSEVDYMTSTTWLLDHIRLHLDSQSK